MVAATPAHTTVFMVSAVTHPASVSVPEVGLQPAWRPLAAPGPGRERRLAAEDRGRGQVQCALCERH